MTDSIQAHDQAITHHYTVHFPEHGPRETDPHYPLFEKVKAHFKATGRWKCAMADRYGTDRYCQGELELHHDLIEYAILNAVDLALVQKDFPSITDEEAFLKWIESDEHLFEVFCLFHHRGHAGKHTASAADWEGEQYVKGLIS